MNINRRRVSLSSLTDEHEQPDRALTQLTHTCTQLTHLQLMSVSTSAETLQCHKHTNTHLQLHPMRPAATEIQTTPAHPLLPHTQTLRHCLRRRVTSGTELAQKEDAHARHHSSNQICVKTFSFFHTQNTDYQLRYTTK